MSGKFSLETIGQLNKCMVRFILKYFYPYDVAIEREQIKKFILIHFLQNKWQNQEKNVKQVSRTFRMYNTISLEGKFSCSDPTKQIYLINLARALKFFFIHYPLHLLNYSFRYIGLD